MRLIPPTGPLPDDSDRRVVLRNTEDRVLLPPGVAHQGRSRPGRRGLDRGSLQPGPQALRDRTHHPRRLRDATLLPDCDTTSSRITPCPPSGVRPTEACCDKGASSTWSVSAQDDGAAAGDFLSRGVPCGEPGVTAGGQVDDELTSMPCRLGAGCDDGRSSGHRLVVPRTPPEVDQQPQDLQRVIGDAAGALLGERPVCPALNSACAAAGCGSQATQKLAGHCPLLT